MQSSSKGVRFRRGPLDGQILDVYRTHYYVHTTEHEIHAYELTFDRNAEPYFLWYSTRRKDGATENEYGEIAP